MYILFNKMNENLMNERFRLGPLGPIHTNFPSVEITYIYIYLNDTNIFVGRQFQFFFVQFRLVY